MTLSRQALEQNLSHPFRFYHSVDSTNDIAIEWLLEGAEAGSVVIADEQLTGKGRKGRVWYTPPGVALALSLILKPSSQYATRINMLGACAVYDLCTAAGIHDVGIKWPNDVQVAGKKISGILPEAVWTAGELVGIVLGIGVNVRVPFTAELANTATNLEDHVDRRLDRAQLIAALVTNIQGLMRGLESDAVFRLWSERINTLGQFVKVEGVVGKAHGVDHSGALLIKIADGSIKRVLAGDVHLS